MTQRPNKKVIILVLVTMTFWLLCGYGDVHPKYTRIAAGDIQKELIENGEYTVTQDSLFYRDEKAEKAGIRVEAGQTLIINQDVTVYLESILSFVSISEGGRLINRGTIAELYPDAGGIVSFHEVPKLDDIGNIEVQCNIFPTGDSIASADIKALFSEYKADEVALTNIKQVLIDEDLVLESDQVLMMDTSGDRSKGALVNFSNGAKIIVRDAALSISSKNFPDGLLAHIEDYIVREGGNETEILFSYTKDNMDFAEVQRLMNSGMFSYIYLAPESNNTDDEDSRPALTVVQDLHIPKGVTLDFGVFYSEVTVAKGVTITVDGGLQLPYDSIVDGEIIYTTQQSSAG